MSDSPFKQVAVDNARQVRMFELADLAEGLLSKVEDCPPSRERALAVTNLEQAVMWANKAISRDVK